MSEDAEGFRAWYIIVYMTYSYVDPLQLTATEYIDLYLIHYPIAWAKPSSSPEGALKSSIGGFQSVNIPLIDTWKAMEDLVRRNLVRTIGVSNCTLRHLDSIIPHAS